MSFIDTIVKLRMILIYFAISFFAYDFGYYVLSAKQVSTFDFPQKRIVKGFNCSPADYPYLVSIVTESNTHFCGGSLLTKNFVLTAGHCCEQGGPLKVWTGLTEIRSIAQSAYIDKKYIHPNYSTDPLSSDLCIVHLSSDILENQFTKYISLIDRSTFQNYVKSGKCTMAVAMGFGYQGIKYPNETPKDLYRVYNPVMQCIVLSIPEAKVCDLGLDESMFCAIDPISEGHDPCQGDSGGPLVCRNSQVGIISAGYGCGLQGHASVYTRVDLFRDFLNEVILFSNVHTYSLQNHVLLSIICTVVIIYLISC